MTVPSGLPGLRVLSLARAFAWSAFRPMFCSALRRLASSSAALAMSVSSPMATDHGKHGAHSWDYFGFRRDQNESLSLQVHLASVTTTVWFISGAVAGK